MMECIGWCSRSAMLGAPRRLAVGHCIDMVFLCCTFCVCFCAGINCTVGLCPGIVRGGGIGGGPRGKKRHTRGTGGEQTRECTSTGMCLGRACLSPGMTVVWSSACSWRSICGTCVHYVRNVRRSLEQLRIGGLPEDRQKHCPTPDSRLTV